MTISLMTIFTLMQAITDSVLLKLSHTGKNFRNYEVHVSRVRAIHRGSERVTLVRSPHHSPTSLRVMAA